MMRPGSYLHVLANQEEGGMEGIMRCGLGLTSPVAAAQNDRAGPATTQLRAQPPLCWSGKGRWKCKPRGISGRLRIVVLAVVVFLMSMGAVGCGMMACSPCPLGTRPSHPTEFCSLCVTADAGADLHNGNGDGGD
jgi:hypothetical protein